ncbi:MAG: OmpA family protein [Candidatus Omnitrophica bacterium]|nr:OmpA family protein [Candidatus Omnitrophota bacterium]MBU0896000.1 OmpA family protein [Candidatus Omnitrophota bacterium]MBU1134526.1 OmpA family protein [Candidatus Omnitrophota bacterium]MBU1367115.1 OmpA family protein [Candidatus Omnitrophota bacterium]MBU1523668.1 OmpA family protein [Candidatus Omnitrophota bacterium]
MKTNILFILLIFFFLCLNGCAVIFQKGRRSDIEKIKSLQEELEGLRSMEKVLKGQLTQEIKDKQVSLKMEDKGLVITFVAEVLFDSGKAVLRKESLPILGKVAKVLKDEASGYDIGIEGHTDNEPIKHSPWKTNWELSAHRALSVLGCLESEGIASARLRASGYGQYHPVASNDTSQGRFQNRRVEIVVLHQAVKKIKGEFLEKKPVSSYEKEEFK